MDIVIGLPNHVADVDGPSIREWAQRAQQRGFAGLATIDRLVYPSLDSIVSLSLAAGATTDIGLITNVLLAPLYPAALLTKQIGSLAAIAGDRLTLGLGVGNRPDDYTAAGVDFHERGRILDQTVELMRRTAGARAHCVTTPTRQCSWSEYTARGSRAAVRARPGCTPA